VTEPKSAAAVILGRRVRSERLRLAISQETLAELAGLHWTFVGQVERGERNLSLHNIVKLAGGLDVDPAVLVSGIQLTDLPVANPIASAADRIRAERQAATKPVA
jgi:transcriptional regulator with XRE-family HTH domain